jgi:hypothetical protein
VIPTLEINLYKAFSASGMIDTLPLPLGASVPEIISICDR